MARSVNKVTLLGNVGQPPDVRTTASGSRVAKCSLATSKQFKDRAGTQQEKTQWHRLTFFGRLADVVEQWVGKGDRLYIEGELEYSTTQDDQGNTRYWTDIIVREMVMLGSRDGNGGSRSASKPSGGSQRPAQKKRKPFSEPDDDLPF